MIESILAQSLTLLIFVPFIVGSIVLLTPFSEKVQKTVVFVTLMFIMLLAVNLFMTDKSLSEIGFIYPLILKFGVDYNVGVDGVSLLIIMIVALSFPPIFVMLSEKNKGYWANMLLLQSSLMGVVLAQDLIMFYIFWEAMLIPVFIMVGLYGKDNDGGKSKVTASIKLLLYTMFGSLIMLLAIIYLGYKHSVEFGEWSFAISNLANLHLSSDEATYLFFGFMLAFSIKIPIFPFHQWLSDAYARAPIGVTFALSAVASKVAVYAIVRFVLPLFPSEFIHYSNLFISIGIFSMIFFALSALAQTDLKRVLAYSSASHLGLVVAGIFALNYESLSGSVFQIVAHALGTGLLFLLVAILESGLKTREINHLRGVANVAPIFAIFFAVGLFSIIGLPSTSGFIGEFLIILGLIKLDLNYGLFATFSIVIGAVYMLRLYRKVMLEEANELTKSFKDLKKRQISALLPFLITIFALGLYPKLLQDRIEPTIKTYLSHIEKAKDIK